MSRHDAPGPHRGTARQCSGRDVLAGGVRVQVVCPGVVRSQFHARQGMDFGAVPRMEPHQIVEASLADLADGVLVSVPGLADTGSLTRLETASHELVSVARTTELPPRYRHVTG
jgi:uncharacterized protein